jgi:hypothetical protein
MGDGKGTTRFEPPPWEREAFDALAARRAEEDAARAALEAAESAAPSAPVQEPDPWDEVPAVKTPAEDAVAGDAGADTTGAARRKPDELAVEAMLIQLQGEERSDSRATAWVGWIASAITLALGTGMLITGLAMVRRGNGASVTVIGSAVLSVFGLVFIGMALWVWITTSRSRGRR